MNNSVQLFYPEEFKNKILKLEPTLKVIQSNFEKLKKSFIFIIKILHEELNKEQKNNKNNNNNNLDESNQLLMFNNFFNNYFSKNQSIMSDLFFGVKCNIIKCLRCNTNKYNHDIYYYLEFSLKEVHTFKNNCDEFNPFNINYFNNNFQNNNGITIYDCLDYSRKLKIMSGVNSIYCNNCTINSNCSTQTLLATGPNILILILNREQDTQNNIKFIFNENLNLNAYIQYNNNIDFKYKLIGVISYDYRNNTNNLISYCRDPITGNWIKYNSDNIIDINDFQNEINNFIIPCILFFEKEKYF